MVVPLDTLAGWPEAVPPTVLQTLGLLIGIPLLVFLAVIAISKIVTNIHASRGTGLPPIETMWVGGKEGPVDIEPSPEESRALSSGPPQTADQTGGAGARW
jgi:hypothetical protein